MSIRAPAPGRSLAERYPTIAASWDHEANGELKPADVAAQAGVVVHWRCAAGHRWSEQVAQRTKDAQWKEGDPAACRLCSGHYIEVAFNCGHALTIPAWRSPRGDRPCPNCRQAVYEEKRIAYEQNRDEVLAACRADAGPLADALWQERGYDLLAVPLHKRALTKLRGAITYSLVGERAFGSSPISPKLLQTLHELDQLLERVPADRADGPVTILGEAFWGRALSGEARLLAAEAGQALVSPRGDGSRAPIAPRAAAPTRASCASSSPRPRQHLTRNGRIRLALALQ